MVNAGANAERRNVLVQKKILPNAIAIGRTKLRMQTESVRFRISLLQF